MFNNVVPPETSDFKSYVFLFSASCFNNVYLHPAAVCAETFDKSIKAEENEL